MHNVVKKKKCDFGMAFDGDADRIFFTDEKGDIINPSLIAALVIKKILKKHKNVKIIYNLINSKIVPETIRKFKGKPEIDQVLRCIEAANLAPSPGNLSILKYIIIEELETINKISEACQQDFIEDAAFVVVICSDKKRVEKMYEEHTNTYIKHHSGAAIENFLLKIADLGLASCWIGAFSDETLKTLLRISDDIDIEAVLPIGFGKGKQEKKPNLAPKVFFEKWKNKSRKPSRKVRREDI